MLSLSSRRLAASTRRVVTSRSVLSKQQQQTVRHGTSSSNSVPILTHHASSTAPVSWSSCALGVLVGAATLMSACQERPTLLERIPTGGDIISAGTPVTEPATGILFPQLCNGYHLVGCGVRVKYGFIKVYAVGTYVDFLSMSAIKKAGPAKIQEALLDPNYPRTIRIVMNRGLSIDKYTAAIVEALEPRMKGQDLDKLEEFKQLNPPVDLVQGAEIEMTIRGDTLLYKNAVGGVGTVRSLAFTKAMCDVYYGSDPVSPGHKEAVVGGIPNL